MADAYARPLTMRDHMTALRVWARSLITLKNVLIVAAAAVAISIGMYGVGNTVALLGECISTAFRLVVGFFFPLLGLVSVPWFVFSVAFLLKFICLAVVSAIVLVGVRLFVEVKADQWCRKLLARKPLAAEAVREFFLPMLRGQAGILAVTLLMPTVFEAFMTPALVPAPPEGEGGGGGGVSSWSLMGSFWNKALANLLFATTAVMSIAIAARVFRPTPTAAMAQVVLHTYFTGFTYVYGGYWVHNGHALPSLLHTLLAPLPCLAIGAASTHLVRIAATMMERPVHAYTHAWCGGLVEAVTGKLLHWFGGDADVRRFQWLRDHEARTTDLAQHVHMIAHTLLSFAVTSWCVVAGPSVGEYAVHFERAGTIPLIPFLGKDDWSGFTWRFPFSVALTALLSVALVGVIGLLLFSVWQQVKCAWNVVLLFSIEWFSANVVSAQEAAKMLGRVAAEVDQQEAATAAALRAQSTTAATAEGAKADRGILAAYTRKVEAIMHMVMNPKKTLDEVTDAVNSAGAIIGGLQAIAAVVNRNPAAELLKQLQARLPRNSDLSILLAKPPRRSVAAKANDALASVPPVWSAQLHVACKVKSGKAIKESARTNPVRLVVSSLDRVPARPQLFSMSRGIWAALKSPFKLVAWYLRRLDRYRASTPVAALEVKPVTVAKGQRNVVLAMEARLESKVIRRLKRGFHLSPKKVKGVLDKVRGTLGSWVGRGGGGGNEAGAAVGAAGAAAAAPAADAGMAADAALVDTLTRAIRGFMPRIDTLTDYRVSIVWDRRALRLQQRASQMAAVTKGLARIGGAREASHARAQAANAALHANLEDVLMGELELPLVNFENGQFIITEDSILYAGNGASSADKASLIDSLLGVLNKVARTKGLGLQALAEQIRRLQKLPQVPIEKRRMLTDYMTALATLLVDMQELQRKLTVHSDNIRAAAAAAAEQQRAGAAAGEAGRGSDDDSSDDEDDGKEDDAASSSDDEQAGAVPGVSPVGVGAGGLADDDDDASHDDSTPADAASIQALLGVKPSLDDETVRAAAAHMLLFNAVVQLFIMKFITNTIEQDSDAVYGAPSPTAAAGAASAVVAASTAAGGAATPRTPQPPAPNSTRGFLLSRFKKINQSCITSLVGVSYRAIFFEVLFHAQYIRSELLERTRGEADGGRRRADTDGEEEDDDDTVTDGGFSDDDADGDDDDEAPAAPADQTTFFGGMSGVQRVLMLMGLAQLAWEWYATSTWKEDLEEDEALRVEAAKQMEELQRATLDREARELEALQAQAAARRAVEQQRRSQVISHDTVQAALFVADIGRGGGAGGMGGGGGGGGRRGSGNFATGGMGGGSGGIGGSGPAGTASAPGSDARGTAAADAGAAASDAGAASADDGLDGGATIVLDDDERLQTAAAEGTTFKRFSLEKLGDSSAKAWAGFLRFKCANLVARLSVADAQKDAELMGMCDWFNQPTLWAMLAVPPPPARKEKDAWSAWFQDQAKAQLSQLLLDLLAVRRVQDEAPLARWLKRGLNAAPARNAIAEHAEQKVKTVEQPFPWHIVRGIKPDMSKGPDPKADAAKPAGPAKAAPPGGAGGAPVAGMGHMQATRGVRSRVLVAQYAVKHRRHIIALADRLLAITDAAADDGSDAVKCFQDIDCADEGLFPPEGTSGSGWSKVTVRGGAVSDIDKAAIEASACARQTPPASWVGTNAEAEAAIFSAATAKEFPGDWAKTVPLLRVEALASAGTVGAGAAAAAAALARGTPERGKPYSGPSGERVKIDIALQAFRALLAQTPEQLLAAAPVDADDDAAAEAAAVAAMNALAEEWDAKQVLKADGLSEDVASVEQLIQRALLGFNTDLTGLPGVQKYQPPNTMWLSHCDAFHCDVRELRPVLWHQLMHFQVPVPVAEPVEPADATAAPPPPAAAGAASAPAAGAAAPAASADATAAAAPAAAAAAGGASGGAGTAAVAAAPAFPATRPYVPFTDAQLEKIGRAMHAAASLQRLCSIAAEYAQSLETAAAYRDSRALGKHSWASDKGSKTVLDSAFAVVGAREPLVQTPCIDLKTMSPVRRLGILLKMADDRALPLRTCVPAGHVTNAAKDARVLDVLASNALALVAEPTHDSKGPLVRCALPLHHTIAWLFETRLKAWCGLQDELQFALSGAAHLAAHSLVLAHNIDDKIKAAEATDTGAAELVKAKAALDAAIAAGLADVGAANTLVTVVLGTLSTSNVTVDDFEKAKGAAVPEKLANAGALRSMMTATPLPEPPVDPSTSQIRKDDRGNPLKAPTVMACTIKVGHTVRRVGSDSLLPAVERVTAACAASPQLQALQQWKPWGMSVPVASDAVLSVGANWRTAAEVQQWLRATTDTVKVIVDARALLDGASKTVRKMTAAARGGARAGAAGAAAGSSGEAVA